MHYHFKVHKETRGYWAECVELEGCVTQGNTLKELQSNMEEALNLYLDEPSGSTFLAPLPNDKLDRSKKLVQVAVDPEIAFAFMVRYHRIKRKMTQKQAAKKLGMSNLYSYQRLERKCNATLAVIAKVKNLFPEFSVDFAF
ncbi:type II toxin-antitoxin system HicB family antitoxin [Candidatus Neptunochlamydia vexilliferae]|uniref:HTH cro/C1-type domain-containing protein n=1 Tax=Candidatus Neptunichlamydia vexilliferae TaxID=1651774 RepID=A0ABS0B037_9BACT|nr:type II toxin-antitoxin system HicB family antitoxin [Candidatus Neptunochlamydia vexilliferae]MBF5059753.1 hypothetical protein [Candidatus Neptunochlamydia vexilliferae]